MTASWRESGQGAGLGRTEAVGLELEQDTGAGHIAHRGKDHFRYGRIEQ